MYGRLKVTPTGSGSGSRSWKDGRMERVRGDEGSEYSNADGIDERYQVLSLDSSADGIKQSAER